MLYLRTDWSQMGSSGPLVYQKSGRVGSTSVYQFYRPLYVRSVYIIDKVHPDVFEYIKDTRGTQHPQNMPLGVFAARRRETEGIFSRKFPTPKGIFRA